MRHGRILELIWQGDMRRASGKCARRLQRSLSALVPLRTIVLTASCGVERSSILSEDSELLPEITLADVLAEELSVDVPSGSFVVVSDAGSMVDMMPECELSYDLGVLIADLLLGVIRSGVFPLKRETDALYTMAASYHDMIAGAAFRHLGLVPDQFRAGLAAGLCTYWAGARSARTDTSGLFLGPDFLTCPKLLAYLKKLDANFTAPDRTSAGLMVFEGGPVTYADWLNRVHTVVTAQLDAHSVRQCQKEMQRQARVKTSPRN